MAKYPRIVYEVEGSEDRHRTKAAAFRSARRKAREKGRAVTVYSYPGGAFVSGDEWIDKWTVGPAGRENPRRRKKSPKKRISAALTRWLRRENPGMRNVSAVRVRKLKGGGVTIIPVR